MREPEEGEQGEGADERHRNGQGRNEGRPPSLEEDEDHDDHQDQRFVKGLQDLLDALRGRLGRVERETS